jgi:cytochrome c-type biogenesis protein CcmH/NrfG
MQRNERDAAVQCWQHALELDPTNAAARQRLESIAERV